MSLSQFPSIAHDADWDLLRDNLKQNLLEQSVRFGSFTLASGAKSDVYVDMKPTTLHPNSVWDIAQLWNLLLKKDLNNISFDGVGGLTLGADPLATAFSLLLTISRPHAPVPAFLVRKEPKKHGTEKYIEGLENFSSGAKVIILEDVATTGGSALKAIHRARAEGLTPVAVLAVVDREQGAAESFQKEGLPFAAIVTLSELRRLATP